MVCAPVQLIIPLLKLGDYLSVQAHKTMLYLSLKTSVLACLIHGSNVALFLL